MTIDASANSLNLRAFLERFLGDLRDQNIAYCILRNHDHLPEDNLGSDIDMLVDADRVAAAIELLWNIPGVVITGCVARSVGVNVFVAGVTWRAGSAIQVDLIRKLSWKGLPYLQASDVLKRAHTPPGRSEIVRIPAAADEAINSFFCSYLVGGWIKDRYQAEVRETFAAERQTVRDNLEPAFGATLAEQLIDAVIADDHARMLSMLPKLRRTLLFRSMRHAFVTSLYAIANHYGHEVVIRFTAKYLISVSVFGPDGAGKSAVLQALEPRLASTAKTINVRHLKADIFFRAHRQDHGPVTDPHGKPPRSTAVSLLKFVLWALEGWIDRLLLTDRRNRTLDIWDRYFHDIFVDPKRYRYRGPMWLVRAIGWFVPSPDLFIFLDAPTEVLRDRKREVAAEETERQRQAYRDLANRLERVVVVDANRPHDMVVSDAAAAIIARLAEKTQRFLGSRV